MQSLVAELLQNIGSLQVEVMACGQQQVVKQSLCQNPLFEPFTAFRRLDQNNFGFLSLTSLEEFLSDHKMIEDSSLLYRFMDSDNDGLVDFQDQSSFVRFVLPQSTEVRQLVLLRESYVISENMFLPQEAELELLRLFISAIDWLQQILQILARLYSIEGFDKMKIYINLCDPATKMISAEQILNFLQSQGIEISTAELINIFNFADRNRDNLIDYNEYLQFVLLESSKTNQFSRAPTSNVQTPVKSKKTSLKVLQEDQTVKKLKIHNNIISEIMEIDQRIMECQNQLSSSGFDQNDFNQIFNRDVYNQKEFQQALQRVKIDLDEEEIKLFFSQYAKGQEQISKSTLAEQFFKPNSEEVVYYQQPSKQKSFVSLVYQLLLKSTKLYRLEKKIQNLNSEQILQLQKEWNLPLLKEYLNK